MDSRFESINAFIACSVVPPGEAFWYLNANKLVEFAVNRGRADTVLGLKTGTVFKLQDG